MKYSDLTDDQKQLVGAAMKFLRPATGELARLCLRVQELTRGSGPFSSLITGLDAGEVIPNSTDLAGAVPLSREQIIAILGDAAALIALNTDAARNRWVAAAGPLNCVGG